MRLHFDDGERELFVARLGLAEDADDAAIGQAVATWMAENDSDDNSDDSNDETNAAADVDVDASDGVFVDASEYVRLRRRDAMARQIEENNRRRDRDELIEEAIADGKFAPARRQHYRDRYDSDPDGTTALIGRLQTGSVPLEERGQDAPTDEVDASAYPTEWVPEVRARTENGTTGSGRRSRVHTEG